MKRIAIAFAAFLAGGFFANAQGAEEVVIASYNVENYLRMERRVDGRMVPDAPKPENEISAIVEVVLEIHPDILGLEEMGDEEMLEDFHTKLKVAGLDYPYREWVKGSDPARHLALFSRFPIVARNSRDDVPFELNGTRQCMERGILDVTIQLSDTYRLRLVGAHLKSKREIPGIDQQELRAREAVSLRDHLNKILNAAPSENLMLFGDLNEAKNEYAVKELIGSSKDPRRMKDLFLTDRYGYCWTHFWSAADIYSRIDYMMASSGLLPEIVMEKSGVSSSRIWYKASDHRAIFSTIKIPGQ